MTAHTATYQKLRKDIINGAFKWKLHVRWICSTIRLFFLAHTADTFQSQLNGAPQVSKYIIYHLISVRAACEWESGLQSCVAVCSHTHIFVWDGDVVKTHVRRDDDHCVHLCCYSGFRSYMYHHHRSNASLSMMKVKANSLDTLVWCIRLSFAWYAIIFVSTLFVIV